MKAVFNEIDQRIVRHARTRGTSDDLHLFLALAPKHYPLLPSPQSYLPQSLATEAHMASSVSKGFITDGQTLSRGGVIRVSGTPILYAAAGTDAVIGTSTEAVHNLRADYEHERQ